MVILRTQSEFGHAPPPQTPYSIVTNMPGWSGFQDVRDGDFSSMAKVVHIYPRFTPMHAVAKLAVEIGAKLGVEGKNVFMYLNPVMWPYTQGHITRKERDQHVLKPDDVELRCVDVAGHRLYLVLFKPEHGRALMLSWGSPGLGLSGRAAEVLLKDIAALKEVTIGESPPPPTWTPESEAHQGLRERINSLLHRAPINPDNVKSTPDDVYLYPTGMAAVFYATNLMLQYRPGTVVVAGLVFHNTYHHLIEESPHGWKHQGRVDDEGIDQLEAWLEDEKTAGRMVSYVLLEFPGNPTLETPDLARIKRLSEKYGFVLIADDTISGFGNVDILAYADVLLTSLTKTFSGLANVMGGSIVLNPLSPHYAPLSRLFASAHHNELFAPDADVLLANSAGFLARTGLLNRNARAMAEFLHSTIADPASPVASVQYPTLLATRPSYDALRRRATAELEPGYGCLLTVEFESVATAAAFFDRCGFYPSPHLGGHVTIMMPYNMMLFTKRPEEAAYMRGIGVKEESVRISAGPESEEDLIDTLKDALEAAREVKKNGKQDK